MNDKMKDIVNILVEAADSKMEQNALIYGEELVNIQDVIKEKRERIEFLSSSVDSEETKYNTNVLKLKTYCDAFTEQLSLNNSDSIGEMSKLLDEKKRIVKQKEEIEKELALLNNTKIKEANELTNEEVVYTDEELDEMNVDLEKLKSEQNKLESRSQVLSKRAGNNSKEHRKLDAKINLNNQKMADIYNSLLIEYSLRESKVDEKASEIKANYGISLELAKETRNKVKDYSDNLVLDDHIFEEAERKNEIFDLENEIKDLEEREKVLSIDPKKISLEIEEMVNKKEDSKLINDKLASLVSLLDKNVVFTNFEDKIEYESNAELENKLRLFIETKEKEINFKNYFSESKKNIDILTSQTLNLKIKENEDKIRDIEGNIKEIVFFGKSRLENLNKLYESKTSIENYDLDIQNINKKMAFYSMMGNDAEYEKLNKILLETKGKVIEKVNIERAAEKFREKEDQFSAKELENLKKDKILCEKKIENYRERLQIVNEKLEKDEYIDEVSRNYDDIMLLETKTQLVDVVKRQEFLKNNDTTKLISDFMLEYAKPITKDVVLQDIKTDPMDYGTSENETKPVVNTGITVEPEVATNPVVDTGITAEPEATVVPTTPSEPEIDDEEDEVVSEYPARQRLLNAVRQLKLNKELLLLAFVTAIRVVTGSYGLDKPEEIAEVTTQVENDTSVDIGEETTVPLADTVSTDDVGKDENELVNSIMVTDNADDLYLTELMSAGKLSSSAEDAINSKYATNVLTRDQIPDEIMVLGVYYDDGTEIKGPIGVIPNEIDSSKISLSVGTKDQDKMEVTGYISVADINEMAHSDENNVSKGM